MTKGLTKKPSLKAVIDEIAMVPKEEGFIYKAVAMNYQHLPYNVDTHLKWGYEIVETIKDQIKDERAFSPDSNQDGGTIPSPVTKTASDGTMYILMRISQDKFDEMMKEKNRIDTERYKNSIVSEQRQNTKKGVVINRKGPDFIL